MPCDRFGQTLFHEVSRTCGVDVAQFLVEQGKGNQSLVIVLVTFYLRHKEGGNVSRVRGPSISYGL